ncbi:hypothetical protein OGAPHI_007384 [Ogataea philodendri]|uniref:Uncharacterized protein n=1 Tax=Ogataea philodendri TaxID=1378263 RepID=A0A9P8NW79_9ASCO|nr:uncharacterized protein OGAPHI_007384 [Ogataea philodendri]KAH3660179.1 hypothetical protein OGAPHI_007384 [Ogataea philodendri]
MAVDNNVVLWQFFLFDTDLLHVESSECEHFARGRQCQRVMFSSGDVDDVLTGQVFDLCWLGHNSSVFDVDLDTTLAVLVESPTQHFAVNGDGKRVELSRSNKLNVLQAK